MQNMTAASRSSSPGHLLHIFLILELSLLILFTHGAAGDAAAAAANGGYSNFQKTTKLTGFASSKQTSIFSPHNPLIKATNDDSNKSKQLYVRHAASEGVMYLKVDNNNDATVSSTLFQVNADDDRVWDCQPVLQNKTTTTTATNDTNVLKQEPWIPLEGVFGIYIIPSGTIWVLVTGSQEIYNAPPIIQERKNKQHSLKSWLQIRKVTDLELVHIPNRLLSASQLKEEVRQVQLLRKGLKQHSFYYVAPQPSEQNGIVPDMTKNLQRSFRALMKKNDTKDDTDSRLTSSVIMPVEGNSGSIVCTTEAAQNATKRSTSKCWWEDPNNRNNPERPDSRFFWNEAAIEPIIQRYHADKESRGSKDAVAGNQMLLEHMIPLTSAFVGAQRNVVVSQPPQSKESSNTTMASKQQHHSLVYDELLISRRSRFRAGTRFTKRGADATGAVANYAETEQVCLILKDTPKTLKSKTKKKHRCLSQLCSHIQTRGSIPLRWSSPTDIKTYRPRIRIGVDPVSQTRALMSHLLEQLSLYTMQDDDKDNTEKLTSAKIVFVNLIDKHSDQGRLGRAFDAVLEAVKEVYAPPNTTVVTSTESLMNATTEQNRQQGDEFFTKQPVILEASAVEHIWWDFHAEVKNGRWHRLASLLEAVQPALKDHGYFSVRAPTESKSDWRIERQQRAVVRTNCMDCLDRTNVVQSVFGRWVLFRQLEQSTTDNITGPAEPPNGLLNTFVTTYKKNALALPWDIGEVAHRLLWADNADAISRLYAGTPALKGDFTRTGKRTKRGALDDGMNSLQRYYLNNFLDADRQEGTDLMVGYQSFSNLDDDVDDDRDWYPQDQRHSTGSQLHTHTHLQGSSDASGTSLDLSTMTLQEAARQMMLGNNVFKKQDDDGDKNHARIKDFKGYQPHLRKSLDRVVGGASVQSRRPFGRTHLARPFDLRWLPGDVQDHMRSRAMAAAEADALAAMDQRAASAEPWWVVLDSSSDDETGDENGSVEFMDRHQEIRSNPVTKSVHAGYAMSAALLGTRAPAWMAALVVLLVGASYFQLPRGILFHEHYEDEEERK